MRVRCLMCVQCICGQVLRCVVGLLVVVVAVVSGCDGCALGVYLAGLQVLLWLW